MYTRTITETIPQPERPVELLPAREFFTGRGTALQAPSNPVLRLSLEQEERVRMRSDEVDLEAALANLNELVQGLPDTEELQNWLRDFANLRPVRWARAVAVLYVRVVRPHGDESLLDLCYKILQLLHEGDVDQFIYTTELGLRIEPLYLEALVQLKSDAEEQEDGLHASLNAVNRGVVRASEVIDRQMLESSERRVRMQLAQRAELEETAAEAERQRQELLSVAAKIAGKAEVDPALEKSVAECKQLLRRIK